ncbi:AHH domain-containing protein [Hahella ganghwensis]|uniref:AHH domain-containing protein n=1 Tax=Hahella ganghwensis TaxID=286420 RepID=UPI000375D6BA|nr:AHH domain-containing protein [Hahella ganghwensis]
MAKNSGHFGDKSLGSIHKEHATADTTEGGACLTGHKSSFTNFNGKHTCNYRYQCYEQAKSHADIKKCLHSYRDRLPTEPKPTSVYPTKSGSHYPARYCTMLEVPEPGDWDIGGPERDIERDTIAGKTITIKEGYNFTTDTWPYWNNAHHLIPKGTLSSAITNEGLPVSNVMQKALLTAQYNINHKKNMLFLPMDKEVGKILDVPRHLILREDDEPDLDAMCQAHPVYDEMVKEMDKGLEKILKGYRKICNKAVSDNDDEHVIPDAKLDKAKLEKLSETLLETILDWEGGRSLDGHAKK